jgi:hypothetical protein
VDGTGDHVRPPQQGVRASAFALPGVLQPAKDSRRWSGA